MQTRRNKKPPFDLLGEIALLMSNCNILIARKLRSEGQLTLLRRALQLFFQNRLAAVLEVKASSGSLPANAQEILSLRLTDTALPRKHWVGVRGILRGRHPSECHVGDLFLFRPHDGDWRSDKNGRGISIKRNVHVLALRAVIEELGLPLDLDLNLVNGEGIGWQPPYAEDENVLKRWATPMHDHDGERLASCPLGGCSTVGEMIREGRASVPVWKREFVPPSWVPSRDLEACRRHTEEVQSKEARRRERLKHLEKVAVKALSIDSWTLGLLEENGIQTVADLVLKKRDDLRDMVKDFHIGCEFANDVEDALRARNLTLNMYSDV